MTRVSGLLALFLAAPAGMSSAWASPWHADYVLSAVGVDVMEVRVSFDLADPGYRIETRARSRGLGAVVSRGAGVSHAEGDWTGPSGAQPRFYASEGRWRSGPRRVEIAFGPGGAAILTQEPLVDRPRTDIPPDATRGAVDTLSALALLARQVERTGRCDLAIRLFDGRRLADAAARTAGTGPEGMRCEVEMRQIAGFPLDREADASRQPQRAQAWFARPRPDGPAVPVRVELARSWWGRIEMRLVGLEASPGS